MSHTSHSAAWHYVFLGLFAVLCIGVWMLPLLVAGFPIDLPYLHTAFDFLQTNTVPTGDGRLRALVFGVLGSWIPFTSVLSWALLSAFIFALTLCIWWCTVARVFDRRTAWGATVLLAFFPLSWRHAVALDTYALSFLFLFASFYAYNSLYQSRLRTALAVFGMLFGLALACKDVFLLCIPVLVVGYMIVMQGDVRTKVLHCVFALFIAFVFYSSPLIGHSLFTGEFSFSKFVPLERTLSGVDEFYGDHYTYDFDREGFEQREKERIQSDAPLIERMRNRNRMVAWSIVDSGALSERVLAGSWLTLTRLPDALFPETLGGVVLWLFFVPGIVVLWRRYPKLLLLFVGWYVFQEVCIRFYFLYERSHLINLYWMFALCGGLGVGVVSEILVKQWKSRSQLFFSVVILAVLMLHLLQVNRSVFAREYKKSSVPEVLLLGEQMRALPDGATVGLPLQGPIEYLGEKETVFLREDSLERALETRKLNDAFSQYGITHIALYPDVLSERVAITSGVRILNLPEYVSVPPSPTVKFLLHLFR